MRAINDKDLGEISIRQSHQARQVRFKISPRGELVVTAPPRTPLFIIKQAIRRSKPQLKEMLAIDRQQHIYSDGQAIGQSHRLAVVKSDIYTEPHIKTSNRIIILNIAPDVDLQSPYIQKIIQTEVIKTIKKEAKSYLGKRLARLAERHNFSYASVRYTHTGTRWGSCSSQGTISLNIALMKLPLDVIDYVLIHELCHTKEMNHSTKFWSLVSSCLPGYKSLRKQLKSQSPSL